MKSTLTAIVIASSLTLGGALSAHTGGIHSKPHCAKCCKQGKDAHCCAKCKDDKKCAPCCDKK